MMETCGGKHPNKHVAGIDFVCDGRASTGGGSHRRTIVARFRHATCPDASGFNDGKPWMRDESLDGDTDGYDGQPRYRLVCPSCTFNHVLTTATLDALMAEVWVEHARRVERRNVADLVAKFSR